MFNRKKFLDNFNQPDLGLTEDGKVRWVANAGSMDIFPKDFANDTPLTVSAMLARRILALEERVERLERNA
jgi:hypothetical protein